MTIKKKIIQYNSLKFQKNFINIIKVLYYPKGKFTIEETLDIRLNHKVDIGTERFYLCGFDTADNTEAWNGDLLPHGASRRSWFNDELCNF